LKEYQLNTIHMALIVPFFLALRVLKDIADLDCVGFLEVQVEELRDQT